MIDTIPHQMVPTVKVAHDPFDEKSIAQCDLCIEIDESRFRFCFIESESKRCVWLEDFAFDTILSQKEYLHRLVNLVKEHPYLSSDQWKKVRVAVNAPEFTMIPAPLFRREYAGDYLQLATGRPISNELRILYYQLTSIDAFTVFTIPNHWSDWLLSQYPLQDIEFYHLTNPLIVGALAYQLQGKEPRLLTVHLEESYFTLIYIESQKLKFCNRFHHQNPTELTYLILFAMSQLGVHTELSRFLPHIRFGSNPTSLSYISAFDDLPEHRYFGLMNTFLVQS
jgi:hypothetical protein